MNIVLSERLRHLPPEHNPRMDTALLNAIQKFGADKIINMTIGSPDKLPKHKVVEAMTRITSDATKYGYVIPAFGSKKLLRAGGEFRERFSGVKLNPDTQMASVHGSRIGLFDAIATVTDPKDLVMLPGMFYPGLRNSVVISYCRPVYYSVLPKTEPFEQITESYERAKLDFGRPPKVCVIAPVGNPYGKALSKDFFPKLIEFALERDLIIISDEAYLYHVFSGKEAFSLMQFEGGAEVGISLFTMSKIANVPSCRAAFLEGAEKIIGAAKRIIAALEYGLPWWVQEAVIEALKPENDEFPSENAALYEERDAVVAEVCAKYDIEVWRPDGGMFTPIVIPDIWGNTGSEEVVARVLEQTGVRLNAGKVHGEEADGILRAADVVDKDLVYEGCERMCPFLAKGPEHVDLPEDASSAYHV